MLYKKEAILLALAGVLIPSGEARVAGDAEIRFQPVGASGNVISLPDPDDPSDSEIILSAGGVTVTLFLEVSRWDTANGGHPGDPSWFIAGVQGTVESDSYAGGLAPDVIEPGHPGNPGTIPGYNLEPLGRDVGQGFLGSFQALKVCTVLDCVGMHCPWPWDLLSDCGTNPGSAICTGAMPACVDRPDFMFNGLAHTNTVSTMTLNHTWLSSSADCREDPRGGTRLYFGTLLLNVPAGAKGTYNVSLIDDANFSALSPCPGPILVPRELKHASITIAPGRCCSNLGVGPPVCEDVAAQAECDTRPRPRVFTPLASCSGESVTDCNDNGVPDECDILAADCNDNAVPDDCEADSDDDGVIDGCDACPDDPDKNEPGVCGCGVDDAPDADGDGLPDCRDQCPGVDDAAFAPECADVIPAVSTWGLVILVLSLLVGGKVYFARRPVARRR